MRDERDLKPEELDLMLSVLLILVYLFKAPNLIHAVPVSLVQRSSVDVGHTSPPDPILHHRSILDIIWTCAPTIDNHRLWDDHSTCNEWHGARTVARKYQGEELIQYSLEFLTISLTFQNSDQRVDHHPWVLPPNGRI